MKINDNGVLRDFTEAEEAAYTESQNLTKEQKIAELEKKLFDTDYIACKIAEGSATREEYAEVIAKRQNWRDEINALA